MAGFSDKIKKMTKAFSKKGKKMSESPFDSDTPPFLQGAPDMGYIPDISSGLPFNESGNTPPFPQDKKDPQSSTTSSFSSVPHQNDLFPGGGQQQSASEPSVNNEMLEENKNKIKEVESKLSKADVTLNLVQRDNEEIRKTVDKIDQSVLELLSLYEIVSNQVNPFVGDDVASRDTIERFEKTEKRINELGDMLVLMKNDLDATAQNLSMPQGISEEVSSRMQNVESKMDAFVDAMAMMHESMEQLSSRTDDLFSVTDTLDRNIIELAQTNSNISSRLDEMEKSIELTNEQKDVDDGYSPVGSDFADHSEKPEKPAKKSTFPMIRLENIKKDPTSVVVLLNWIEFLMERVGRNNLMDALDYYVDIGWISEDVMSQIMAYARGIDYYVEKPTWRLLPEDHTKSLLFIEKLSGRKIDRNMLSSIDREMAKVKHGLEELYGI